MNKQANKQTNKKVQTEMNNLTNKEANKLKTHRQENKLIQQATERTKQHASSVERSRRTHENSYKYRQITSSATPNKLTTDLQRS